MGKIKNYERKARRDSGLGTIDALWKLMIDIYWSRKEGRHYSLHKLCEKHQVSHFNSQALDGIAWDVMPTREDADALRIRIREYEKANYNKHPETPADEPMLDLVHDVDTAEGDDFGILILNGQRYRLVPID